MQLISLAPDLYWDDLPLDARFHTAKRTLTESDLVSFVNLTWVTEELFANADPADRAQMAIAGRVVPGGLVYTFAEGLVSPSFRVAGLAFLGAQLDIKAPAFVGDTVWVDCEVIERRATSGPNRGLVRTRNTVRNQHGQALLVYTPLRLMRMRSGAAAPTSAM